MERGVSPIIVAVLLIAIAVTASIGVYFWLGGLATKQPTTTIPIIANSPIAFCNPGSSAGLPNSNITILVENLGASQTLNKWILLVGDGNVLLQNSSPLNGGAGVPPSSHATVTLINASRITAPALTVGSTYIVYSNESGVGSSQVICQTQ
jgi:flagellin-like protein